MMRVGFAGSGSFAVPSLEVLTWLDDAELVLVVTRPDQSKGRGRRLAQTPVAERAAQLGVPVVKPSRIAELAGDLRELDLLLVADYGELLPESTLRLPRLGSYNLHGSLLPRWRGAAPCAWAIRAGDRLTGVTCFRMVKALDAGPILTRVEVPILPDDTAGSLEDRLADEAAQLTEEALGLLEERSPPLELQDAGLATRAPKLRKEDGLIDWTDPAEAVERQIRAMQPWPRAFSFLESPGKAPVRIVCLDAAAAGGEAASGQVIGVTDAEIEVACGAGSLVIRRLQPEGRREMRCEDFLRGHRVAVGDVFVDGG